MGSLMSKSSSSLLKIFISYILLGIFTWVLVFTILPSYLGYIEPKSIGESVITGLIWGLLMSGMYYLYYYLRSRSVRRYKEISVKPTLGTIFWVRDYTPEISSYVKFDLIIIIMGVVASSIATYIYIYDLLRCDSLCSLSPSYCDRGLLYCYVRYSDEVVDLPLFASIILIVLWILISFLIIPIYSARSSAPFYVRICNDGITVLYGLKHRLEVSIPWSDVSKVKFKYGWTNWMRKTTTQAFIQFLEPYVAVDICKKDGDTVEFYVLKDEVLVVKEELKKLGLNIIDLE
jgi:hypothetical protein